MAEQQKFWAGKVNEVDDFGKPITNVFIDGKTSCGGSWGIMSQISHRRHGVGVGIGLGQVYEKQSDGRWLKVGG